jgi:IS605 OrfB family transposase
MPKSEYTLPTTIVGEWIIDDKDKKDVDDEMRLFQCAVRTAFNRLLEGIDKGDVEKLVSSMFKINSRYAKDAVMQAQSLISSQRELVKQHKQEKERLISGLRKKLGKFDTTTPGENHVKSEDKRESISAKIEQLNEEVVVLEGHIENSTIPKVIFGGRENFEKRVNGKLSNADWKNLRNNKLYSRGDKSKEGGNLNTRIVIDNEGFDTSRSALSSKLNSTSKSFSLSVAISHKVEKPKTAPRVCGKLWVDVRHQERLREHLEDGGIYSIELIRGRDNKYRVHITFDELLPYQVVSFKNGACGVDLNPDGIALTETSSCGNLISSEWIALPELTYSNKNQRDNLIGETATEVVRIATSLGKGLVIESLNFVKKNKGKQFNRMSHNFVYRRLLESIERKAKKCGVALKKVNPAYTSVIGKYKYATLYGLSFHQAAAFVIARRGLGFRERIPKKIQRLILSLISKLNSLLPAMEAKGRRQVKRLLNKLENWRNIHSWSFWYTFNKSLRKVGVKHWLLRDINLLVKVEKAHAF